MFDNILVYRHDFICSFDQSACAISTAPQEVPMTNKHRSTLRIVLVLTLLTLFPLTNTKLRASGDITNGQMAFTSDRDGNWEIYVMDEDGSNITNLTGNKANDTNPTWSPARSKIAFTSWRTGGNGVAQIWVMDADGNNPVQLTSTSRRNNYAAAW